MPRVKDWMVALAISAIGGLVTGGIVYGSMETKLSGHEGRIMNIEAWKDRAIEQLGNIDGKIDALLRANDVKYEPKK